jgi:hypothetical protein
VAGMAEDDLRHAGVALLALMLSAGAISAHGDTQT